MPDIITTPAYGEPVSVAEAKLHMRITDTAQDLLIGMLLQASRTAAEVKTRQQFLISRHKMILDRFPMAGSGTPLPFDSTVNIPGYAIMLMWAPVRQIVSIDYLDMSGTLQTMPATDYVANTALKPGIVTPQFGKIWPISLPQIAAVSVTYDTGYASPIYSVNTGLSALTVKGPFHWSVGDTVEVYNSGGALPAGLVAGTPYLVATASGTGTYTLTDLDGVAVTITDSGSGLNFLGVPEVVPAGIRNWILIRTASLYENREEVAVLQRGHVEEIPFMDGLLDPFKVSMP